MSFAFEAARADGRCIRAPSPLEIGRGRF